MYTTRYETSILKNGIRVVSEHIPYVKSVAVGIWVGAGSRFESEEYSGISHFLEHLFFKGTEKRSAKDIAESLDSVGGQLNAFTTKEYTCYYAKVLDDHLELALDVLSDMFFNSKFSEKDILKEREVIIEEIKMYEDTPDEIIHDLFSRTIWEDHPLGRPVLGTEETISTFTRDDFLQFIKSHYVPDNIVISLAGKVDHTKIIEVLDKLFGDAIKGTVERYPFPPHNHFQIQNVYRDVGQVQICLGSPGLPQDHPQIYPLYILNSVLGGGLSSRLVQEVREERGLAYSVYSYHSAFSDAGLFTFYAGTRPDNYEQVIQLILKEAFDIANEGITEKELLKTKEQLKGNLYLGLESVGSRMTRIGRSLLSLNRLITPEEVVSNIDLVTLEEVKELAHNIFNREKFTIATIGPIKTVKNKEYFLME
ncbi:MAG: zinc protease [Peptococcaceae bacterium BICA1-8]|nr:MAG: zinc protease [Peptococcaceae bacterium BICA1-8]